MAATNYEPHATADDGSCTYAEGCTDRAAANFNATATRDDGSCTYPDVYGDGAALRAGFIGLASSETGGGITGLRGWGAGDNPCGGGADPRPWEGLACGAAGRVTSVDLRSRRDLGGFELGPALGNLTSLTTLSLGGTQIEGTHCHKCVCFGNRDGSNCDYCSAGRHAGSVLPRRCLNCQPWEMCTGGPAEAADDASPLASAYACPGGYQASPARDQCVRCPARKVRPSANTSEGCIPCSSTEDPDTNQTGCVCKEGYVPAAVRLTCLGKSADFSTTAFATVSLLAPSACVPCRGTAYECVECHGGGSRPTPVAGYAAASSDGVLTVFECPDHDSEDGSACLGGDRCANGNTGLLCHVCESEGTGYQLGHNGRCVACPSQDKTRAALQFAVVLLAAVVLVLLVLRRCCMRGKVPPARPLHAHEEHRNPLGRALLEGVDGLTTVPDVEKPRHDRDCWKVVARANVQSVRIVVGFGQVVGQLGTVLHVEYPDRVTSILTRLKTVVSFDFLRGYG
eukprot:SAG22_NODE_114_length_19318_cov_13.809980_1_plen_511_part_10